MQTTKSRPDITRQYTLEDYLKKLTAYCGSDDHFNRACKILWDLPSAEKELPNGLEVALILAELSVDKLRYLLLYLVIFV